MARRCVVCCAALFAVAWSTESELCRQAVGIARCCPTAFGTGYDAAQEVLLPEGRVGNRVTLVHKIEGPCDLDSLCTAKK